MSETLVDEERQLHVEEAQADSGNALIRAHAPTREGLEKSWLKILRVAKRLVNNRPDDHLSSLLADLRELDIGRRDPGRYYRSNDAARRIGEEIMRAAGLPGSDDFHYPEVRNGSYRVGNIGKIRYLQRLIRSDTTAVVELGSGWSCDLFQLYIAHGATKSRKIIYYGGEYTDSGQICAKYLARRDPFLKYKSFMLDFRDPNISFLARQKGHILIFTSHAIDQVNRVNPALFAQLKEIANDVTMVHIEPVGWQRVPELLQRRESADDAFFEALGEKAIAGSTESVTDNAAWWSWRLDYNTNLLRLVNALEQEGSIEMRRVEYDFDATANVFNPASLIHYDFIR